MEISLEREKTIGGLDELVSIAVDSELLADRVVTN